MRKLVILIFIAAVGCHDIADCDLDPDLEYAVVGFYNSSDSSTKVVDFNLLTNTNSNYSYFDSGAFLAFPLDPNDQSLTYLFETDSDTYDLTFLYEVSHVQLYAVDCGGSFTYDSLDAETTTFDSVAVIGPILNKNILVNVEVYF